MAIALLKAVPHAFSAIGAKINECIASLGKLSHIENLEVETPLELIIAQEGSKIVIDIRELDKQLSELKGGRSGVAWVLHYNDGTIAVDIDAAGVTVTRLSNGKYISLDPSTLTQNMEPTEWAVSNNGTPGNAMFLSSSPY